jgi:hypothetical protein
VFEHLGLVEWPFRVTPDTKSAAVWADRVGVHSELVKLIRSYRRTTASSINLLWAFFGAGKTHFLRHLEYLASNEQGIATHYSVFPKTVKSFVQLYATLARSLPLGLLVASYTELESRSDPIVQQLDPQLITACRSVAVRPELQPVVAEWLAAGRPLIKDLREAGISSRIDSSERAIEVCGSAIRLVIAGKRLNRVVWMIDEFQRIGLLRPQQQADINIGLHSVFNDVPLQFSLMLSFSFGDARNIRFLLSDELLDRAQMQQFFQLPALTLEESTIFVHDLLIAHRPDGNRDWGTFPFADGAIEEVLRVLGEELGRELKPRSIMQAFDAVLSEMDLEIEEGRIVEVSAESAIVALRGRAKDALEVGNPEDPDE